MVEVVVVPRPEDLLREVRLPLARLPRILVVSILVGRQVALPSRVREVAEV